ncbi:hypothetical protein LTR36_009358 [Oleoguttula mirabilis]|uniref:RRM domain-containing protein n=1 Tax=Oleoguttula mirabilis TaxID=1507867 RepID=A0AAV9JSK6_9PEZI|nr:hypothetical protein LTR36_009358 [Oleoguttula mirabilis]
MSRMNGGRGNSASPTNGQQNGGVSLNGNLHATERAHSVYSPYMPYASQTHGCFAQNSSQKLHPGAHVFKPTGPKLAPTPIRILNRDSTPDEQPTIVTSSMSPATKSDEAKGKTATAQQPIGTRSGNMTPPRPRVFFTTDVGPEVPFLGGHYIKIENISRGELNGTFAALNEDFDWQNKVLACSAKKADGKNFVYLCCFDDLRDASQSFSNVEMVGVNWPMSYITHTEFASNLASEEQENTSFHEGQVIFVASFEGPTSEFNASGAGETVHELAKNFGEVRAFTEIAAPYPNLEFRVEYYKISDAKNALNSTIGNLSRTIGKWSIAGRALPNYTAHTNGVNGMAGLQGSMAGMDIHNTPHRHRNAHGGPVEFTSPTGRTAWTLDENGNQIRAVPVHVLPKISTIPFGVPIIGTPHRDRFNSAPMPQTPAHIMNGVHVQARNNSWNGVHYSHDASPRRSPIPSPQAVVRWKIENGQDVRTTVMLRNIPNRMNCWELKEILDHTSMGDYDFSYLRIDFEKGTNVGYAFVNFADPMTIMPFVDHYEGRRWQPSNKRLVELSYATVQGFDCLVEKFRNSAIMSEYKDYRPKLWYTPHTAPDATLVGSEQPFPQANNQSKKQRSHDNAGQIGLYAPRSGQMSRERGRRSQFDRGTPAQMQEDAYFNQMSPLNGYGNGYAYGMSPRMAVGPPPSFPPIAYGNGYAPDPYMHGNAMMPPQQYGYGPFDGADPFGPVNNYHGGYINGHNASFGTGPNTPASRLRTQTNGRLGGRPKNITTVGGPVQHPGVGYGNYTMPKVMEQDETAAPQYTAYETQAYDNVVGPQYYQNY